MFLSVIGAFGLLLGGFQGIFPVATSTGGSVTAVPTVAGVLILVGICYLNVRLIYANVARSSGNAALLRSALRYRWRPLLLIGIALLMLIAVPVLNLLVPALMCTSVLHLAYRDNIGRLAVSAEVTGMSWQQTP